MCHLTTEHKTDHHLGRNQEQMLAKGLLLLHQFSVQQKQDDNLQRTAAAALQTLQVQRTAVVARPQL